MSAQRKTVIVTGGNSGIGKITAHVLIQQGYDVIIVCRNQTAGEQACAEFNQTGPGKAQLVLCDFSRPKQIQAAAERILEQHPSLELLVNNAGAYFPKRFTTDNGLEMTFAVNHLGYFHFTALLLPALLSAENARIVNVASRAHTRGKLHFDDLHYTARKYNAMGAYSSSKLMNVLFTFELARRLAGTRVTANCLHPGVIRTGFGQDHSGWFNVAIRIAKPLMISPEKGAETSIYLATSPEVQGVTGTYFAQSRPKTPHRRATRIEDAKQLWKLSETLIGQQVDPGQALAPDA